MSISYILMLSIYAMLINNVVLMQFLGICPYLGVSKKTDTAMGMGGAVIFVMTMATIFTWLIEKFILIRFDLVFLRTIAFILVIASLVQVVEIILKKVSPPLYQALGVFLPLITTNCAIMGVALLIMQRDYNLLEGTVYAIGNSIGFALALILFAGLREHLELMDVPKGMRGMPIALVVAGILSLAFMGFLNIVKF